MRDDPIGCCPFCLGLGLPACCHLSGCWNRDAPYVVRPPTMTRADEDELLALLLALTARSRATRT